MTTGHEALMQVRQSRDSRAARSSATYHERAHLPLE
jgi:hypothetical protein